MRALVFGIVFSLVFSAAAFAGDHKGSDSHETKKNNECIGAGPQSPRDIDVSEGINPVLFEMAPSIENMNLCNVHFHRNAEHKSAAYSTFVEDGSNSGWACKAPTAERLKEKHAGYKGCDGIAEGDTIEVHWVHTTCDISTPGVETMGGGLNACVTTICPNPQLRVVAQVFTLSKDGKLKFSDTSPVSPDAPSVLYTGSTTGTSFSNDHCSPFQVTWDVKKTCEALDIDSFAMWCAENKYDDHHAHGVRELVTSQKLLSEIK